MKRVIRSDERKWRDKIASEVEDAARNQDMRMLYRLTKVLCNERSEQNSATILDKRANLVSGKTGNPIKMDRAL